MGSFLLGLDIGSSECKAVIFDCLGCRIESSQEPYLVNNSGNYSEIDPEILWKTLVKVINKMSEQNLKCVEALTICSHGETLICIDKNGKEIKPAIMNSDNRAKKEIDLILKSISYDDLYISSGAPPHPMFPLAKILWLKTVKIPHLLCFG